MARAGVNNQKWKKKDARAFFEMLPSASVGELKTFVVSAGYQCVPSVQDGGSLVMDGCLHNPSDAMAKMKYLIEDGMFQDSDSIPGWSTMLEREMFSPERLDEMTSAIRGVLQLCLDNGLRFQFNRGNGLLFIALFYDDHAFLNRLEECGIDYARTFEWLMPASIELFKYILENDLYPAVDFMLKKGLEISRWSIGPVCGIASGSTTESKSVTVSTKAGVDYFVSKGTPFSLNYFNPEISLDLLCYAMEKTGYIGQLLIPEQRDFLVDFWSGMLKGGRSDVAEYLLSKGVPTVEETLTIGCNSAEFIDWCLDHGLNANISIDCDKPTLLYAAHRGLAPVGYRSYTRWQSDVLRYRGQVGKCYNDMQAICETLDKDLIGAFLDAGFTEGIDVSGAVDTGNQELLDLYQAHGVSIATTKIVEGSSYIHNGVAVVPEGKTEVGDSAFENCAFHAVQLPSTLKKIGEYAFSEPRVPQPVKTKNRSTDAKKLRLEVVVPKSVESVGLSAFGGFDKITVYDSIDPTAPPADDAIDSDNGHPNGRVGWLGILQYHDYVVCAANAVRRNHEITVRSAQTDEVKYRVYMPIADADRKVYCTLVSAWGKNASFHFPALDDLFEKLPNKDSKLRTCINRLMWPVQLSKQMRYTYATYLVKFAKAAVAILAEDDDIEGMKLVAKYGGVKKSNIKALIACAEEAGCVRMLDYLKGYDFNNEDVVKLEAPVGFSEEGKPKFDDRFARLLNPKTHDDYEESFEMLLETMSRYPLTVSWAYDAKRINKRSKAELGVLCSGDAVDVVGTQQSKSPADICLSVFSNGCEIYRGAVLDDTYSFAWRWNMQPYAMTPKFGMQVITLKRCFLTTAACFLLPHTRATVQETRSHMGECNRMVVRLDLEPFDLGGLRDDFFDYLKSPASERKRSSIHGEVR